MGIGLFRRSNSHSSICVYSISLLTGQLTVVTLSRLCCWMRKTWIQQIIGLGKIVWILKCVSSFYRSNWKQSAILGYISWLCLVIYHALRYHTWCNNTGMHLTVCLRKILNLSSLSMAWPSLELSTILYLVSFCPVSYISCSICVIWR